MVASLVGAYDAVEPHFPIVFKAFNDYILHAHTLSAAELNLLSKLLQNSEVEHLPTLDEAQQLGMSTREHTEFTTWLESLLKR